MKPTKKTRAAASKNLAKENLALRKAIKQKTIELETKERQLEIEAALEKVRAIALAMKEPADMLAVCKTISLQLKSLGVKEIRNVQTAIFYEEKKTYMNYEYYAKHKKTFITDVSYSNHKIHIDFATQMMKGKGEFFSTQIKGKKQLKDWIDYQKTTNVFIDRFLETAKSLNYYWYSLGPVALGISTYSPLNKEEKNLFTRFRNVFELAYRRYMDIEKAESQARAAQIEAALERVRSRTMAMHQSGDLHEVIKVVTEQLAGLGIKFDSANFARVYADGSWDLWLSTPEQAYPAIVHVPYLDHRIFNGLREITAKGLDFFTDLYTGEEKNDFFRHFFENSDGRNIPDARKQYLLNSKGFARSVFLLKNIWLSISNYDGVVYTNDENAVFRRFANVFEQSYTRFLDLQNAEAQAREAQIQLALERVRARTMAMHRSDELAEVSSVLFKQLSELGNNPGRISIGIPDESDGTINWWATDQQGGQIDITFKGRSDEATSLIKMFNEWKADKRTIIIDLQGEELTQWLKFCRDEMGIVVDEKLLGGRRIHNVAFFSHGWLNMSSSQPQSAEIISILERFAAVFNLTYQRFLDLQKAEVQAREAQIEAALERVRARTMAMQKSDELLEVIQVLSQQFLNLNFKIGAATFALNYRESNDFDLWLAVPGRPYVGKIHVPYFDHPLFRNFIAAKEKGLDFFVQSLSFEEKNSYFKHFFENAPGSSDEEMKWVYNSKGYAGSEVLMKSISLGIANLEAVPYTDEENAILKRFAAAFEQSYIRFSDLQKAETQARKARLEVSLEKVRSRTMAMHKSDELSETAAILIKQLNELGIEPRSVYIGILKENSDEVEIWSTDENGKEIDNRYATNINNNPSIKHIYDAWKAKRTSIVLDIQGKELEDWVSYWREELHFDFKPGPFFDHRLQNVAYFSNGFIAFTSLEEQPAETIELLENFAAVFNLTYTRFNDLQKAELQAREATIEAALEKVRGKAMAMHNSNDLSSAASMVFTELRRLGIAPIRCGVCLLTKESRRAQLYSAVSSESADSLALIGWVDLTGHPVLKNIYDTWLNNEEYYPELSGEKLKSYYELLLRGLSVNAPDWQSGQKQYGTFLPFTIGCLYAWSEAPYNETEIKILKRFASIIDLTFRRYMDLQQSEASAKEAVKQAALDRVRADIASMRTISDLDRITPLIWNELTILGVPFIRCGVFIMDESQQLVHTFLSTPDGKAIAAFHLPYDTPGNIGQALSHWRDKKNYIDHWDESAFIELADILVKQGAIASPDQYLSTIPHGGFYLHFLPFLQGMLYVGNLTQLGEGEINLVQSVADAFSTAYARYEDFNKLEAAKKTVEKTLVDLKQAQTLLVQAEKMASLGELTAGIAHEIQNPLNFVNNFSEVNTELITELLEEVKKGNIEDAQAIADDIKQNLEKINHHGKRADSIVKGMLQHSRTSSGQKELTDINALAEEYLRLAYHGLRAKDKTFNAKFETHFDNNAGKINIVPQEVGRVILNLVNNSFYAVSQRQKTEGNDYEPTVSISTSNINGKVEISVKDNGTGISQKNLDKIFQPFFTTKPTGHGTGLGLSLSYDIVKAHGGEIKVNSKEGEGSEFIIRL